MLTEKKQVTEKTPGGKAPKGKVLNAEEIHQRIRIRIRAFDHKIIDQSTKTIIDTALRTGAKIRGPVPLPTIIRKHAVNRATFKYNRAKDVFEVRTHKRLLDIIDPNPQTVESLMSLSLPAGVDVEIKM